ncbi:MAG: AMP-binding protein, partial [Deltaproteobacteria bacterium]|nr:AMP-binding protein [Deltaproteobacteria bacterium]
RRHFDAWMPDAWVPIAALPLRADGRVDVAALERLEVVDPPWIDALERRFAALAGVAEVAIVEREPAQPRPLLHLAEVLPDQHDVTEDASAAAGESVPEDAPVDREAPPAIVHGPALEIEPSAPRILAEALKRAAGGEPQRGVVYLDTGDEVRRQSYAELVAEAECIVGGLRELGARPGERVLFQLDRNQDFLPAFWACTFAGLVPVPLAVPAAYEAATA